MGSFYVSWDVRMNFKVLGLTCVLTWTRVNEVAGGDKTNKHVSAVSGSCCWSILDISDSSTAPCCDQVSISCWFPSFHTADSDPVLLSFFLWSPSSRRNKMLNVRILVHFSKKWSDFEPRYQEKRSRFSPSVSREWQIENVELLTALSAFIRLEKLPLSAPIGELSRIQEKVSVAHS